MTIKPERSHDVAAVGSPMPPDMHLPRASIRDTVLDVLERSGLPLMLAALFVFFSVDPATSSNFTDLANIRTLLGNQTVTALLALAAIIPLIAGQFDVSIGAVLGISAIVVAKLTVDDRWPALAAIAVAVVIGAAFGAINGLIVAYFRVSSFIVTLGMSTLIGGLASLYSDGQTIIGIPQPLLDFGNRNLVGIPRPVWLLAVVATAIAYVLRYTIFGRQLLSIGSNGQAARLVGIDTARRVALSFIASGALAALAGAVQLTRTGSASAQVGPNFTLGALAAAFLGATTITPGRFNVNGTLIGVLLVGVAVNGLTILGVADWVEPVFDGGAVVIAVALSALVARRRGRTRE